MVQVVVSVYIEQILLCSWFLSRVINKIESMGCIVEVACRCKFESGFSVGACNLVSGIALPYRDWEDLRQLSHVEWQVENWLTWFHWKQLPGTEHHKPQIRRNPQIRFLWGEFFHYSIFDKFRARMVFWTWVRFWAFLSKCILALLPILRVGVKMKIFRPIRNHHRGTSNNVYTL